MALQVKHNPHLDFATRFTNLALCPKTRHRRGIWQFFSALRSKNVLWRHLFAQVSHVLKRGFEMPATSSTWQMIKCHWKGSAAEQTAGKAATLLISIVCVLLISGCSTQRGILETLPETTDGLETQTLIVATSRAPIAGAPYYGNDKSDATHFSVMEVSVPPDRAVGTAPFPPKSGGNPKKHFMVASHQRLESEQEFVKAVGRRARAEGDNQGAVLVHGFNTNFAEAVVKDAQFTYDLGRKGVNILYSWPSAAEVRKYLKDRENVLFARDSLADTLSATSRSSLSSYIVAGHSMGTFLVMETLRSLALEKDYQTLNKIDAVVLVSADLDIDVFRKQAEVVLATGLPIFLVVSDDDRALSLSALLRGREKRVGTVRSNAELGNIDVSIIDLSEVEDGGQLAHSKVSDSEAFLTYISGINAQGINVFQEHGRPGLFQSGVLLVKSGTDLLTPQ